MKMLKLLAVSALVLCAPVICAQAAPTPQWIQVAPSESKSVTLTFAIPTSIRWCGGAVCSPVENVPANTTLTAFCPSFAQCAADDLTDGLDGVAKDVEVLQQYVDNTITVNTSGTVSAILVPAVVAPSLTFTPGISTNVAVSNIPPTTPANPGLQYLMTLRQGGTTIQLVCTYYTTAADTSTPPQLAAIFTCLPVPKQ